jgi:hypothetical protein
VWQELIVSIPASWHSQPLIVGAESRSGVAYVGLGPPAEVSWITVAKRSLPVCIAWHLGTCAILIFLAAPWQYLVAAIVRRRLLGESWSWVLFPLTLALIGYITFFGLYFFPIPTWWILSLSFVSGIFLCKRDITKLLRSPVAFLARRPVVALWVLFSGVALTILYAQTTVSLMFAANYRFSPASWSTDNQLPVIVGDFLTQNNHVELVKHGIGRWQVSDRPPVLAGLMAPVVFLCHLLSSGKETSQLGSAWTQIVGTCVLTTWIFPVWVILRKAGLKGGQRVSAISLLAISPFFFFNMLYTWPKLLSATLALLGWVLVAGWKPGKRLVQLGLLAGACFSMSLMSHGSAFFGLLAFGCVFITRFLWSHWRLFVLTGAAFLLFTSPWLIWVRYCDPPGNALAKAAFAGFNTAANKEPSVGEAILNAYRHDTLEAWAKRKLQGIETWIGSYEPIVGSHLSWDLGGNQLRLFQFYNHLPALGLWLIPLILVLWIEKGQKRAMPNRSFSAGMFLNLGMIGMGIQLLLMWDIHIIHTYAASTIACLQLAAVIGLAKTPRRMREILSFAIFAWFAVVWVLSPIYDWDNCDLIQAGFILLALAIIGGVLWMAQPSYGPKSVSAVSRPRMLS